MKKCNDGECRIILSVNGVRVTNKHIKNIKNIKLKEEYLNKIRFISASSCELINVFRISFNTKQKEKMKKEIKRKLMVINHPDCGL